MSARGDVNAEALAARLKEIDELRDRGVIDAQEHALARAAALESAMGAPVPATGKPSDKAETAPGGEAPEADRRRTWIIAAVAGAVAVAAIVVGVIFATQSSDTPVANGVTSTPPAGNRRTAPTFPIYTSQAFSIRYPPGWQRETTNQDLGGYFDTTWVSPALGKDAILRVNTSPGDSTSGIASVRQLEPGAAGTPGYQRISITSTTLDGLPAARWEFLTTGDSGHTLRTVDILTTDGTDGWGLVTRNPVSKDAEWGPKFKAIRKSFHVR